MILRPAGGAAAALGGGDGDMEQPDEELSLSSSADSDRKKQRNIKDTREHRLHMKRKHLTHLLRETEPTNQESNVSLVMPSLLKL